MIYPDNVLKDYWDALINLLLLSSCIFVPYNISFPPQSAVQEKNADLVIYVMDTLFLVDIILTFFTVIYDNDYQPNDDIKVIFKCYIRGWFFIDVISIFPFDLIMKASTDVNGLIRITRIGRLYRLVKLTKLLRMFKFV